EEFARAISLALLDYMRKCHARGFTLSLSGGADSAAVAVLVLLGRIFGIEELGERGLKERLASLTRQNDEQSDLASELLTTVYQATANSGEVTRSAAERVARAVGSRHFEFSIDSIVESYKALIAEAIGRPLTWDKDDLPLQNIQARTRAPGVWLLANLSDSLLLSTGNRSEASVGYMTMDGDSCGALSPIAAVSKVFIRKWLLWMEKTGVFLRHADGSGERFAVPALAAINDQQPTAELRPPEAGQTDEGDLMPYSVLNIIEEGVVRRLGGEELLDFVREKAAAVPELCGTDRGMFETWIARFCRMFPRAAWKRRRTARGSISTDTPWGPVKEMICRFWSGTSVKENKKRRGVDFPLTVMRGKFSLSAAPERCILCAGIDQRASDAILKTNGAVCDDLISGRREKTALTAASSFWSSADSVSAGAPGLFALIRSEMSLMSPALVAR
ncbi:MAG: NAD(+) synthase, partial [Thermoguttaceae bacterium]|nr:NAD(+) synthase [Thermoguttaceae bacterium]